MNFSLEKENWQYVKEVARAFGVDAYEVVNHFVTECRRNLGPPAAPRDLPAVPETAEITWPKQNRKRKKK